MPNPRAIPNLPSGQDRTRQNFDMAVRENLRLLTGQLTGKITQLEGTATTDDIIAKINEILTRLQG